MKVMSSALLNNWNRISCIRRFSIVPRVYIPDQSQKGNLKLKESNDTNEVGNGSKISASQSSKGIKTQESNLSYCLDLVKKYEYENFLCTLLLPEVRIRTFIFVVRAFNVEVALIRDQVSQGDIGLGRLTFWRNAVDKIFKQKGVQGSDVPRHPVAEELHRVIGHNSISKKWFVNLIDARERVMNDAAFNSLEDLEAYCDKSVSPILYLGLEALGIKNVDVDHAASHLGKAIGLTNFIRSIPHNAQRRRVLIPQELLMKHNLSQENLIRFKNQEKIQDAVFEIASQAHLHYKKATSLRSKIVKEALPLMLVGTPTDLYLKKLEKLQFNPYDPTLNKRNSWLPLHLYYRKTTRKYF